MPRLNVTKVFIDLVVENRYGAPFNYAFMVTMLVDGAEIVDHNKSVFLYRNVELRAGEVKRLSFVLTLDRAIDPSDQLTLLVLIDIPVIS